MEGVRVLSTKKLQPNLRQFLLNAGLGVIEADFITTRPVPFGLRQVNANLIFTSQNAFNCFLQDKDAKNYMHYPIFCVGSKTRQVIEQAGFTVAAFADYAEELAGMIKAGHSTESFTFFSGNLRRDTLPEIVANAGISFNEIHVYETALTPQAVTSPIDAVLFFSPSGVESFLKVNDITGKLCFCIGATTAGALKGKTERIVLASRPSVENVIVQCTSYYRGYPARS